MIIVTGAAGFIGSHIISGLNARGQTDILAVDDLSDGRKFQNLAVNRYHDYLDYEDFLNKISQNYSLSRTVDAVFHQGACVNTTEWNGRYLLRNNYEYSKQLLHYCLGRKIPFIYASSAAVYGDLSVGRESDSQLKPLNVYAYSKCLFDHYCMSCLRKSDSLVTGLRYFNVYGPRETHKGPMASMAYQGMRQLRRDGEIRLFTGYNGYGPGEQARDFIFITDVVHVNLWCLDHCGHSRGIFNVGTGRSHSFNELARILIDLNGSGKIRYIEFPDVLKSAYQSYTCADITKLREQGYTASFQSLALGLEQYFYEQASSGISEDQSL